LWAAAAACLLWCRASGAQGPLYLHEPFDRITLNERSNNAVLTGRPLDLPDRKVPAQPAPGDKVVIRLLDAPEKAYELEWKDIAKVELFENMLLARAAALVKEGKLDEAYDFYRQLRARYPKLAGLDAAYDDYLYAEAQEAHRREQFDAALVALGELHARKSSRPELQKALAATTEKLVEKYAAAEDFAAARQLLGQLAAWYPDDAVAAKWHKQFQEQAQAAQKEAATALAAKRLRQADQEIRRIERLSPDLPGAKDLARQLHRQYPRVIVGVSEQGAAADPARLDDWAARRSGRLASQTLVRCTGAGPQGGTYVCPVGELQIDKSRRRVEIRLREDVRWSSGDGTLVGGDAARALLAMTDRGDPAYWPGWGELLEGVRADDVFRLEIRLRRPHVRPEAFLQAVLLPYSDPTAWGQSGVGCGPFVPDGRSGEDAYYVANQRRAAPEAGPPKEIVERRFADPGRAVRALGQGQIRAIDRLCPWEVPAVRAIKHVKVEPYGAPLVHCLLPNLRKGPLADGRFRRALVYGIDRVSILRRLCGGDEQPGSALLSGPFAARGTDGSPTEACDETILPRPYDPRLAVALAAAALQDASVRAAQDKAAPRALVLAHPAEPIARLACSLIGRQLALVGIDVELQELAPGVPAAPAGDADLGYAELAMWEPAVDARRLLGDDGLAGGSTPYVAMALRRLADATDGPQVRAALRQVHRMVHQDAAVVPLWQLTDWLAYHESLQGIGSRPITLYDNVEKWQVPFLYPGTQP